MNEENLFSRLAKYSQNPQKLSVENFCTEALAHFFNSDDVFRREFLKVIFDDQRRARAFSSADATTQETLGSGCRVDLILRAGDRIHLVEIKIDAGETASEYLGQQQKCQVQRYVDLKLGNVTYLTTGKSLAPQIEDSGRKLVNHALFEDLHAALSVACVSGLTKMFLKFMEENDMAEPQPFNRTELQSAEKAFATYFKCQSTLNIVRARVNDRFQTNLGAKSGLTRATFERDKNFGYVQCYLAKKFPHAAVRWVGLALSAESDHLDFSVWLWGKRSSLIDSIRRDLVWDDWGDDRGCSSSIRLRGNRSDIPRMVNHAVESSSLLGRAIPRYA